MNRNTVFILLVAFFSAFSYGQNDLEALFSSKDVNRNVINTFKSTRIINNHSVELFEPKQLDLRISHRFGLLNSGLYKLYGLDDAEIRLGLEYGLMNKMMIGFGRSSFKKTYDGYVKYLLVNQKKGNIELPVTVVMFSNIAVTSLEKDLHNLQPNEYPFLGRLSFCHQLLIASKINRKLSIQLMPTLIHFNMVDVVDQKNHTFALGGGFRYLITNSLSVNSEYFYRVNTSMFDQNNYNNSFSIGVDIETGGHVFQLHVTNSRPMHESGFITRTSGDWGDNRIHFGFNISREFSL